MKRLAIFSFYDKNGIVDSYIEYLLDSLLEVISGLIIVVNGKLNIAGEAKLKKFTKHVIKRKNKGFDAGAYSDIVINYLRKLELEKWDEVVLCNDTFFGPFLPFKNIFCRMSYSNSDFWGLNYVKNNILDHIQSYFLVFRKRIVQSGRLFEYFQTRISPEMTNIEDVYAMFEIGIFEYMVSNGYKFDVFSNTENYSVYDSSDICIETYGLPILKKKVYSPNYYNQKQQNFILQYLAAQTQYDVKHICTYAKRQYGVEIHYDNIRNDTYYGWERIKKRHPIAKITENDIKIFLQNNPDIYIYGTGIIARDIWYVYHKYINTFKGFIISEGQKNANKNLYGFPIKFYNSIPSGVAIVIAMNIQNTESVKHSLNPEDKVLFLW